MVVIARPVREMSGGIPRPVREGPKDVGFGGAAGHWVTLHAAGGAGTVHVFIDSAGRVTKGPPAIRGIPLAKTSTYGKAARAEHHKPGVTPPQGPVAAPRPAPVAPTTTPPPPRPAPAAPSPAAPALGGERMAGVVAVANRGRSEEYTQKITANLAALPAGHQRLLHKWGMRRVTLHDTVPAQVGPGFDDLADTVHGCYVYGTRAIHMFKASWDPDVVVHEAGHAVDHALGARRGLEVRSEAPDFKAAVRAAKKVGLRILPREMEGNLHEWFAQGYRFHQKNPNALRDRGEPNALSDFFTHLDTEIAEAAP